MQLALFDFDHTVTTGDSYARFLRRVATPAQLARARWSVGPWLLAYRAGLIPAQAMRARVTSLVFRGRDREEIAAHGEPFARQCLPPMLRPEMMARIDWHHRQGHQLVLVSASLDSYLQPWCRQHGLELICNRLAADDRDRLTGHYEDGDCGPRKAARITARYDLSGYDRIHAYGDSREDRAMLALAQARWYRGRRLA